MDNNFFRHLYWMKFLRWRHTARKIITIEYLWNFSAISTLFFRNIFVRRAFKTVSRFIHGQCPRSLTIRPIKFNIFLQSAPPNVKKNVCIQNALKCLEKTPYFCISIRYPLPILFIDQLFSQRPEIQPWSPQFYNWR